MNRRPAAGGRRRQHPRRAGRRGSVGCFGPGTAGSTTRPPSRSDGPRPQAGKEWHGAGNRGPPHAPSRQHFAAGGRASLATASPACRFRALQLVSAVTYQRLPCRDGIQSRRLGPRATETLEENLIWATDRVTARERRPGRELPVRAGTGPAPSWVWRAADPPRRLCGVEITPGRRRHGPATRRTSASSLRAEAARASSGEGG